MCIHEHNLNTKGTTKVRVRETGEVKRGRHTYNPLLPPAPREMVASVRWNPHLPVYTPACYPSLTHSLGLLPPYRPTIQLFPFPAATSTHTVPAVHTIVQTNLSDACLFTHIRLHTHLWKRFKNTTRAHKRNKVASSLKLSIWNSFRSFVRDFETIMPAYLEGIILVHFALLGNVTDTRMACAHICTCTDDVNAHPQWWHAYTLARTHTDTRTQSKWFPPQYSIRLSVWGSLGVSGPRNAR